MLRRDINDYELYVFDLDGTLYNQPRLRFIMATRLLKYYICHPLRIKELILLQDFRKTKDSWTQDSDEDNICGAVAAKHNVEKAYVTEIVHRWIYENPLSAVAATKDEKIAKWIDELKENKKTVVILSDYPTQDKLDALKITCHAQYCTADERIGALKPSPKGLMVIMSDFSKQAEETLMIGDRDEKDGECARLAGVDYLGTVLFPQG